LTREPAIHHTGLTVSDMDRARAFWQDALGTEVVLEQEPEGAYFGEIVGAPGARVRVVQLAFPSGGPRLELFAFEGGAPREHGSRAIETGFAHVCVACDELDALLARLEQAGGHRESDPVTVTHGANRGRRAVYVRDPDDHVLELIERSAEG